MMTNLADLLLEYDNPDIRAEVLRFYDGDEEQVRIYWCNRLTDVLEADYPELNLEGQERKPVSSIHEYIAFQKAHSAQGLCQGTFMHTCTVRNAHTWAMGQGKFRGPAL